MSKRKLATLTDTNTSKRPDDKPTVTIAIDFGTAGTGYAYSFAGSDVIEAKQPGGQDARKTLTNILLNPDGSLKAFGFEARRMYAENGEGNFFANYKMLLQNVTSKLPDPMAKSLSGQRVSLKSIIVKTLEYVKSEALKECGRAMPNGLTARDCQWVVTVPAIWSDESKGFMRDAAFKAGIISSLESRRLLLALEPESACIACDVHTLVKPGQSFMVLDTGGGTVDITMNRLKSTTPLRFDEIAAPSGGPWGSTFVDDRFEAFVKELVGSSSFDAIKETSFWIELLENWEQVKTSQTGDDATRTINMAPMLEVLPDSVRISGLVDEYNQVHETALKMRGRSTIIMPADFVRGFFKPNFMKIASHCETLIQDNPVDFIFLVGGFAESELMQSMVKERFSSSRCKVVVPVRPGLAVLRGAAMFGLNQDVFASRVARYSYGIAVADEYDPTNPIHRKADGTPKIFMAKQKDGSEKRYVDYVFARLVKVGDKLPAGHKATKHKLSVPKADQTAVDLRLFVTPLGNVDFCDEPSVRQVGTVTIPVKWGESCSLSLEFGATEIKATGTNDSTGESSDATVTYA